MAGFLSRREILKRAAAAGMTTALPVQTMAQALPSGARAAFENLNTSESEILEAIVARLIPSDENGPGALEAGAANYIDRGLADTLASSQAAYRAGLVALDAYARESAGEAFTALGPGEQDSVLEYLEQNRASGFEPDAASFFNMVLLHTIEGTFCDPAYGGNLDFIGWEMIGYPGIRLGVTAEQQRMDSFPEMTRVSAYDLQMFDADSTGERTDDG